MNIYWLGFGVVVAGIIFLVLGDSLFGLGPVDASKIAGVVAMGALLVVFLPVLTRRYGAGEGGKPLIHLLIWLAIIALVAVVYRFRETLGIDVG
ncbi:hypothetical protein [Flaviflagellibacter deserti]|uniref:Uncharacterized protein n=1 Tax=Flaviflagellibacter deserti TaxID=2267266 RepID=A0ABV9Z4S8_9HYPH